jgi:histidinol phosphatase-like enzyme (inositol monophosphatase family)
MSLSDDRLPEDRLGVLETFAVELAGVAGEVILPLFRADHGLEDKGAMKDGAFDPVTRADKGAEAAIRKAVSARFPEHGFIGEEYGEDRPDEEFVWVLDPVDGTRAFISGLPVWTTLIALRHQGRPVVGMIGQSYLGEVFVGTRLGSRLIRGGGERPLRVRSCAGLSEALIATTDQNIFRTEGQAKAWADVRKASRLARFGCDAYAYAMVALGALDLVVETGLKAWDIEAAIPLLEGAGGLVTDWRGEPIGPRGGQMAIAGDRRVLTEALTLLQPGAA